MSENMFSSCIIKNMNMTDNNKPDIQHGNELLRDERYNKGTAFTESERQELNIEGLLPPVIEDIDKQLKRVLFQLDNKKNDLERYILLTNLLDRNETLFFKTLMSDPKRFVPIMYDPTVGEACLKFSEIYRDKSGMYVTSNNKGKMSDVLKNWPEKDIRFICVSSGGRILGLGDLGANGMGIPLGKLQLYTACAAIPPYGLLPVLFDFGTDNETLLNDPFYIGLRQHRPSTDVIDELVEEFTESVKSVFPQCCIHFEDWKGADALRILKKYKNKICCYNDDIQGTSAVVLAGIMGALKIKGGNLKDQRILIFGAGSAGIGIADMLSAAIQAEGKTENEAVSQISLFDINGLIVKSRTDLNEYQKVFAHDVSSSKDLNEVISDFKPSILIGVSTVGKAFTETIVKTMSRINERPVIFALSNPTDHAECSAQDAYTWSDGKVIFAAGIPFDPVTYNGNTYCPSQANNYYCFPGVSLGIYATQPKLVTDQMWIEACKALAEMLTDDEKNKGMVLPPQNDILDISFNIGVRVAETAFAAGLAQVKQPEDLRSWISDMLYKPEYK